uniref:Pectate lyase n=1 Tax=Pectobacterium carotovorum TaxID=554 RepID=Q04085_PECCA|nr:pectate lyase [Pectobacterium carotovorum]
MKYLLPTAAAGLLLLAAQPAMAANTGGYATTDGGEVSGAVKKTARSMKEIVDIIEAAQVDSKGKKVKGGAYPLIITYSGNEDSLIKAAEKNICSQWSKDARGVEIKEFTKGTYHPWNQRIVRQLRSLDCETLLKFWYVICALVTCRAARKHGDAIRIDNTPNVWIDHNEIFAKNFECAGTKDGDTTFESAIDIKKASTNVTISYNYIHGIKKVGLSGLSQRQRDDRLTRYRFFASPDQRSRCGFCARRHSSSRRAGRALPSLRYRVDCGTKRISLRRCFSSYPVIYPPTNFASLRFNPRRPQAHISASNSTCIRIIITDSRRCCEDAVTFSSCISSAATAISAPHYYQYVISKGKCQQAFPYHVTLH